MQSLIILIEFKSLKMYSGLTHWKMNFYHNMENVDPKGIFFYKKNLKCTNVKTFKKFYERL